ncbi:hypothetical protein GYMLUDRAFT_51483 [Collybiopsis luxurians FD-317 M1]|uniref:Uncharacterized protein n=1 Tax=Collybiopsis luxurians FD-317 M1 TaxID=944289 RepID=A0A0D0C553_9AGAR|nr:hypothetical protein GYMLUDRAFT_51483 [Collybiopsis luxurians FD-317 M1]
MAHQYHILNNGKPVGRPLSEDKSRLPKPIKLLAKGAHEDEIKWVLEGDHHGYIAKIRGDPTAPGSHHESNDKVFALLDDKEKAEKWIFEHVPQHGVNQYIILTHDRTRNWVAPKKEGEQIECHPLIILDPPQHSPDTVFELKKVE